MAKKNFGKVIDFIAFVGLAIVAAVLVLQAIFTGGEVINAFRTIGECIAYFITAISAYFFVRSKRNVWWYVAYAVCIVLIIVFMFIR